MKILLSIQICKNRVADLGKTLLSYQIKQDWSYQFRCGGTVNDHARGASRS